MARYRDYSYEQTKLIPIAFSNQILPGTFEYTLNYLIDNEFDLSRFEQRYHNDETGAPNKSRLISSKPRLIYRGFSSWRICGLRLAFYLPHWEAIIREGDNFR